MPKWLKLALTVGFTLAVLAALYSLVDLAAVGEMLASADPFWLAAYLALLVPQLLIAGVRWRRIASGFGSVELSYSRALCQTLGGYSANLVVPGKMGEMVKGLWLRVEGRKLLPFFLVVLEKALDLLATLAILTVALIWILPAPQYQPQSLVLWLVLPLLGCWLAGMCVLRASLIPGGWPVRLANRLIFKGDATRLGEVWLRTWANRSALAQVCGLSVALWAVQVFQFWCMFKVFGAHLPLDELYAGAPLALLAGILPLTTAGVGSRDAALLWWFGPALGLETALSVGILSIARVVLPGALGLPCFWSEMRRRGHEPE